MHDLKKEIAGYIALSVEAAAGTLIAYGEFEAFAKALICLFRRAPSASPPL